MTHFGSDPSPVRTRHTGNRWSTERNIKNAGRSWENRMCNMCWDALHRWSVQSQREAEGKARREFGIKTTAIHFPLNLDLHPSWCRFPRWRLSVTWITSEFSRHHPIRAGYLVILGTLELSPYWTPLKWLNSRHASKVLLPVCHLLQNVIHFPPRSQWSLTLSLERAVTDVRTAAPFTLLTYQRYLGCLIRLVKKDVRFLTMFSAVPAPLPSWITARLYVFRLYHLDVDTEGNIVTRLFKVKKGKNIGELGR